MARNPQFRNEHDASNFPFADVAPMRNLAGDVLPPGVFLDAVFYLNTGDKSLFISKIVIGGESAQIYLSTEDEADIAHGDFELFDPPELIEFVSAAGATAGVIVSDAIRLSVFQSWTVGDHLFEPADAPLVSACQLPAPDTPAGVSSFGLATQPLAEPLWLVGHNGVVLQVETRTVVEAAGPKTVQVVTVNAVGDPNFLQKLCSPDLYAAPQFVKKLVFQQGLRQHVAFPNDRGDVQITGSDLANNATILRITPNATGLAIRTVGQVLGQ